MRSFYQRLKFWLEADRLGPDMPLTHFLSFFPKYYRKLCEKKFMSFGRNSEVRPGAYIINCSTISIGKNVTVRDGSMIFGEIPEEPIIIENDVLLGPSIHIYSNNHIYSDRSQLISEQGYRRKRVLIRTGAWIGANAIILPGVTIGKHSVVGAGSIVTKNVQEYTVVAGNPAKRIKTI